MLKFRTETFVPMRSFFHRSRHLTLASLPFIRRLFLTLCGAVLLSAAGGARADVCTASMTDINFDNVSPVSGQDYLASGTLSVTCTAMPLDGNLLLLPAISTCASLGPGSGAADIQSRVLVNGGRRIRFNLYRAQSYDAASVWGGYASASSINPGFLGLLALGSGTQTFPIYARIAAADLALAVGGSGSATYAASFAGAGSLAWSSGTLLTNPCQTSGLTAPFSFNVTANVVNDCLVNAAPVAFGARGVLNGGVRASGGLSVKCTAGSSYRIALDGGSAAGVPGARKMKNAASGRTVDYLLSAVQNGQVWGDGSAGSVTVDGTGSGMVQQVPVYGLVPGQATPPPGDYADRVTATIYF